MAGRCGPIDNINCRINNHGWCNLDTASYYAMDAEAPHCGFIRVNDRYLMWKYGVSYKDLNCGHCEHFIYNRKSHGICNIDQATRYEGAHACKEFKKLEDGKVNWKPRCPYLSSIGETVVTCTLCFKNIGKKEFETKSELREYTDNICFNNFDHCEIYQASYKEEMASQDKWVVNHRKCNSCCNSSGYTGLKINDGSTHHFCQLLGEEKSRMEPACEWYNTKKREGEKVAKETTDKISALNTLNNGIAKGNLTSKEYLDGIKNLMKQEESVEESERSKNMIQNIEITKLHPHPDNPRKDLGDLTELAESIKSNGILQNLTVVPWFSKITGVGCDNPKQQEDMGYIVVIGHRRLAAAKLAGLTEVPCAISNMSLREQVATMLLENMQRSDLTVYEQAQGFQMMLDLGESIDDISEKTGFSKTTVQRRVKLLELDGEKFKESVERGATLMDFVELNKINDVDLRNSVLDKMGTSNFRYELQRAIDKEKSETNRTLIIAELEKFATQLKDTNNGLQHVISYYLSQDPIVTVPEDAGTVKYFFVVSNYGYITLYKERSQSEASPIIIDEKEKARRECRAALDEISKRAYQLRCDFVKEISNATAKKSIRVIAEYSIKTMIEGYINMDYEDYAEFLGIEINKDEGLTFADIAEYVAAQPERHLLVATYLTLDSEGEHYYNWHNQHEDNEDLDKVYDFLEKLGYEMSDEERSMREGTHPLFSKSEE